MNFGDEIRQAPEVEGIGVAAYLVPLLAFLCGGALVAVFLRRQGKATEPVSRAVVSGAPVDPELERLVDEELRRSS